MSDDKNAGRSMLSQSEGSTLPHLMTGHAGQGVEQLPQQV